MLSHAVSPATGADDMPDNHRRLLRELIGLRHPLFAGISIRPAKLDDPKEIESILDMLESDLQMNMPDLKDNPKLRSELKEILRSELVTNEPVPAPTFVAIKDHRLVGIAVGFIVRVKEYWEGDSPPVELGDQPIGEIDALTVDPTLPQHEEISLRLAGEMLQQLIRQKVRWVFWWDKSGLGFESLLALQFGFKETKKDSRRFWLNVEPGRTSQNESVPAPKTQDAPDAPVLPTPVKPLLPVRLDPDERKAVIEYLRALPTNGPIAKTPSRCIEDIEVFFNSGKYADMYWAILKYLNRQFFDVVTLEKLGITKAIDELSAARARVAVRNPDGPFFVNHYAVNEAMMPEILGYVGRVRTLWNALIIAYEGGHLGMGHGGLETAA